MVRRVAVLSYALLSASAWSGLSAQTEAEVSYMHYEKCPNTSLRKDGCTINEVRRLDPGGTLRVWIKQTRSEKFTIEVRGYTVQTKKEPPALAPRDADEEAKELGEPPSDSVLVELTHNPKYGGYIVTISPATEEELLTDGTQLKIDDTTQVEVKMPGSAIVMVTIDAEEPPYAFTGGISLTSIRNQVFVARPGATAGTYTVTRDKDREDPATVGFSTFVSVRAFKTVPRLWPTIGIGLESKGNTQYYFGAGIVLGRGIFLNLGTVLGQVNILPAGLQIDDTITDPNELTNLATKKRFGLYAGLSFKFLGGGQEAFGRPFAGAAEED